MLRKTITVLQAHGIDALIVVVLAASGYLLSQPLRIRWAQYRADVQTSNATRRRWTELTAASSPLTGSAATVEVLEISDYECPFCRRTSSAVDSAVRAGLRVGYLNYPLPAHPHAEGAAIAALCAELGGRFREMHARLMTTSTWQQDTNWTRDAEAAGVADLHKFAECVHGTEVRRRLEVARALADSLGIRGTPMFVTRGATHRGTASTAELLTLGKAK